MKPPFIVQLIIDSPTNKLQTSKIEVVCDQSNNSSETIEDGLFIVDVYVSQKMPPEIIKFDSIPKIYPNNFKNN